MLLNLMGDDCIEVYNTFKLPAEEREKFVKVIECFDQYFEPRKSTIVSRYKFLKSTQQPGETIDTFVTHLKTLAKNCLFGDQEDSLIRDILIIGLNDTDTKEKLLMETDIDLQKAVEYCRAKELTQEQVRMMQPNEVTPRPSVSTKEINAIDKRGQAQRPKENTKPEKRLDPLQPRYKAICRNCKLMHDYGRCPAYGKECYNCRRLNHFANACRGPKRVNYIDKQSDEEEGEQVLNLSTIVYQISKANPIWHETLIINGKKVPFKLDTGSEVNILPINNLKKHQRESLVSSNKTLMSYSGHKIDTRGTYKLECTGSHPNIKTKFLEFFIVHDSLMAILGAEACQSMGLLKRLHQVDTMGIQRLGNVLEEYKDIFQEKLGNLAYTHDIKLDSKAEPRIAAPRVIPLALRDRVKAEINKMVNDGILKEVREPTEWVHPIVIVQKPNKKVRICMDPRQLNKFIKRQHYHMPTQQSIFAQLQGAKYFTVLDASSAFLQIPLTEKASKLCMVATPYGRFRFCRLPYGLSSAPEVFQQAIDSILVGIEGVITYIDDILVYGTTLEEHDRRLQKTLDCLRQGNLTLAKDKCQIRQQVVKYLGHTLTHEGLIIEEDKLRAIKEYKTPTNKGELQRFLGMITYIGKFIPNLSDHTGILRTLLSDKSQFLWTENETKCLKELKELVTNSPVLAYFDQKKETTLSVDSSSYGLGAVIMQEGHPISYASGALTETQQQYSQIEKELLAIVIGCEKFHYYLYGTSFVIETDHKPILGLLKKPIETLSPCLQRMVLRLLRYDFQIVHVPGKQLYIADALSRAPLETSIIADYLEEDPRVYTVVTASKEKAEEIQKETRNDAELNTLKTLIKKGWPEHKTQTPETAKPYWDLRHQLHTYQDLIFHGHRLVIPRNLRKETLEKLHQAHQGINSCQNKAKISVYWPGMMRDIANMVSRCQTCQSYQRSNPKQPLTPYPVPELPWEIGIDFMKLDQEDYLVVVDYHSKYVEIRSLANKTANTVIKALKQIFRTHGIPSAIHSDNGPPFDSHTFKEFADNYNTKQVTSSPKYPRSNGMIERTIQTIEGLLWKAKSESKDQNLAIMEYNNTPKPNLPSPAEMLMGRTLRTTITTHRSILQPKYDTSETVKTLKGKQVAQKSYADRGTKELDPLRTNQEVMMQKEIRKWVPAKIIEKHRNPNSYVVRTEDGADYRRNRIHLRPREGHTIADTTKEDQPQNKPPNRPPETHPTTETTEVGNTNPGEEQTPEQSEQPATENLGRGQGSKWALARLRDCVGW